MVALPEIVYTSADTDNTGKVEDLKYEVIFLVSFDIIDVWLIVFVFMTGPRHVRNLYVFGYFQTTGRMH